MDLPEVMQSMVSLRAERAVDASSKNLLWEVMNDAWCPSTNANGYVNVGVAENTLMHDHILRFVNSHHDMPSKYLTYNDGTSGSLRLKKAISQLLSRYLHPAIPIDPNHIVVTNGVSSAIEHISWAFTDPGEGILLGRPYYSMFIPDISLRAQATVVPVAFGHCNPFSIEAVNKYEQALLYFQQSCGRRVRALVLCNPHNPLGRCYSRETIIEFMNLCEKYKIHFVSDEIYALSVWENTVDEDSRPVKFESALSIDLCGTIDPRLVHVLWGMSKDFGANGLRLGVIISQANRELHKALKGVTLYSYVSGVTDHLTSLILENTAFVEWYIQMNRQKLSESYEYAVQRIRGYGIEYASGCNAAFFLWVNLGQKYRDIHSLESDEDIDDEIMRLLLQRKVFLASGLLSGSEEKGWFRIVFCLPQEYIEEAMSRIMLALKG